MFDKINLSNGLEFIPLVSNLTAPVIIFILYIKSYFILNYNNFYLNCRIIYFKGELIAKNAFVPRSYWAHSGAVFGKYLPLIPIKLNV
jgi:hypothetical protein